MTMNRLTHALHALALLILGALAMIATPAIAATCTGNGPGTIPLNLPSTITLTSSATPSVPTLLAGGFVTAGGETWFDCTAEAAQGGPVIGDQFATVFKIDDKWMDSGKTIRSPDNTTDYTIWKTSVDGLGIAVGVRPMTQINLGCSPWPWRNIIPTSTTFPKPWRGYACHKGNGGGTGKGWVAGQYQVAFVQIGPIKSDTFIGGTLFEGSYATTTTSAPTGPWNFGPLINFTLPTVHIVGSTCQVATGGVPPVILPTVSVSAFGIDGTTAGETGFMIKMTCPTTITGNVYVSMSDANNGGNTTDRLNVVTGGSGAATGVRLQILNNHQPIKFGTESGTVNAGQANQWSAGKASDINANGGIPLTAQYIRDTASGALKAGTVTGSAYFTLAYQ